MYLHILHQGTHQHHHHRHTKGTLHHHQQEGIQGTRHHHHLSLVHRMKGTKDISMKGTLHHLHLSNISIATTSIIIIKISLAASHFYKAVWLRFAAAVCWRNAASFFEFYMMYVGSGNSCTLYLLSGC
ncbi:hypothetical protein L1049_002220 [Liquidambar formosana]|uniref:Uncharacterized protein n=1 Tax=Liquidambar formosana TaxID=63359 RepID=A0AAP0NF74_LIQFO